MRSYLLAIVTVVLCLTTSVLSQSILGGRRGGMPFPRLVAMSRGPRHRPEPPVRMSVTPLGNNMLLVRSMHTRTGQWMEKVVPARRGRSAISRRLHWEQKIHMNNKRNGRIYAALERAAALERTMRDRNRNMVRIAGPGRRFQGFRTRNSAMRPRRIPVRHINSDVRMYSQGSLSQRNMNIGQFQRNMPTGPIAMPVRHNVNVIGRQQTMRFGQNIGQGIGLRVPGQSIGQGVRQHRHMQPIGQAASGLPIGQSIDIRGELLDDWEDELGDHYENLIDNFGDDDNFGNFEDRDGVDDDQFLLGISRGVGQGGIAAHIVGPQLMRPHGTLTAGLPLSGKPLGPVSPRTESHQINKHVADKTAQTVAMNGVLDQITNTKANTHRVVDEIINANREHMKSVNTAVDAGLLGNSVVFNPLAGINSDTVNRINEQGISDMIRAKSTIGILGSEQTISIDSMIPDMRPNVIRAIGGIPDTMDDLHDDDDDVVHVIIDDSLGQVSGLQQGRRMNGVDFTRGVPEIDSVLSDLGINGATDQFDSPMTDDDVDMVRVLPFNPHSNENMFANGLGENGLAILGINPKTVDLDNVDIDVARPRVNAISMVAQGLGDHPPPIPLPNKAVLPVVPMRVPILASTRPMSLDVGDIGPDDLDDDSIQFHDIFSHSH